MSPPRQGKEKRALRVRRTLVEDGLRGVGDDVHQLVGKIGELLILNRWLAGRCTRHMTHTTDAA